MKIAILFQKLFPVLILLIGDAGMLRAQGAAGSLSGRITDPSGAAVPGAVVRLSAPGSPARSATSALDGAFRFDRLASGKYSLSVDAPGFAPFALEALELGSAPAHLDIRLELAVTKTELTVSDAPSVDPDPSSNVGSLVLKGQDLEALSDSPEDLEAELQALAGPAAGPSGGEIFIDGFSGGRLPPKSAIREIRVNRNPFSAEFDRPGFGRIEIFTKPGGVQFHGQAFLNFSDSRFNARNPFAATKPESQMKMVNAGLSGPLGKRASFSLDAERHQLDESSVVNAVILAGDLSVQRFSQAVLAPLVRTSISPRLDYQLSANHTVWLRFAENRLSRRNQGIGEFSLLSRASDSASADHMLQATETAILGPSVLNETRLQWIRRTSRQTPHSFEPSLSVLGAFEGGGSPGGQSSGAQTRWEVSNITSITHGRHLIKLGGRLRGSALEERTTQNYNGAFVFPSLEAYRATLAGLAAGLSWQQIRAAGGGPSQFSITFGNPLARLTQVDAGLFVQDDLRLRPNFNLSFGLRYEGQSNIADRLDPAPRLGFAWGLGRQPKTVIRGGFGLFYDRVTENLVVQTLRLNGLNQQQYLVSMPEFFPQIPTLEALNSWRLPSALRLLDATLQTPYMMQAALGVERQLPRNVFVSLTYAATRGVHVLRSRNINAPVEGVRPRPGGDIYLYESTGGFRQHQLIANVNARINPNFSLFGFYTLGRARSDTDGAGSFPADSYDLSGEWSRAGFDVRHRVFLGGSLTAPLGLRLSPFITASSGHPFNITLGRDRNGDSIFNDRPAFATDLSRASVILTRWGAFDTDPLAGATIIPRNWGSGPGQFTANLRISRTFGFGGERRTAGQGATEGLAADGPPPGGPGGPGGGAGGPGGPGGGFRGGGPGGIFGESSGNHRYNLTFSVSARNLFNHVNLAPPVGTLSSPLFGTSNALAGGMGPGGSASANRRIEFQVRLSF